MNARVRCQANPLIPLTLISNQTLRGLGAPVAVEVLEAQKPAVSIRKSVTPDFLICLEDGKQFKSLKRHLRTTYEMSPDEYRAKWNLPSDYPMVAPNYSARRSVLAKSNGLGRSKAAEPVQAVVPVKKTRKLAAPVA
ncbi:MAG: MucR family transcriptional regulator [Devosia sp.]|nr:MucR family transcriptional regulator [Devosia sp.]